MSGQYISVRYLIETVFFCCAALAALQFVWDAACDVIGDRLEGGER